jgi:hypothetical protein
MPLRKASGEKKVGRGAAGQQAPVRALPNRPLCVLALGGSQERRNSPPMRKKRRFAVAVTSLLLFYAAETPPHTVHHGLDHDSAADCPVLAISDQTSGELPHLLTLSLLAPLPSNETAPIPDLIPFEKSLYAVPRPRAPPPSLLS